MYINMSKLICLDENVLYPNCCACGKELSPYSITSEELNKLDQEVVEGFLKGNLLRINGISEDKHFLYICISCFNLELIKENE